MFAEATVAEVGSVKVEQITGTIVGTFSPSADIPMRDPATGELTGESITQGSLYNILYSLYMQKALERDAQGAAA